MSCWGCLVPPAGAWGQQGPTHAAALSGHLVNPWLHRRPLQHLQAGHARHRRLPARAAEEPPAGRADPWEQPSTSEAAQSPAGADSAPDAQPSLPDADSARSTDDVWQDATGPSSEEQDADMQGAEEPPDLIAAAAREEAASSFGDGSAEEGPGSTELPGADLLAGSGLAGAADAMAEKEQEEFALQAASAAMFDDRPPGPVYTDSPTTLHRHTEELKPWGYPEEFEWMDLGPQWQAPDHAVTDTIEKHVELTYEQATDPTREPQHNEDNTKYWMSEPQGGWDQKHRWVKLAKTIETPRGWNGRHAGRGRTELHDLVLGDVLAGEITSLILFEGIQVDLGAQWDGMVGVRMKAWEHIGMQLKVRQEIVVRIHQVVMQPRCRYPVQLELLEPAELRHLMMPLQCWEPTFEGQQPMTEREVERLREYIPPGEVRDLVSNREAAMAELAIQPSTDRRTMVATERRLVEQLRNDSKQKQRRNVSRGNAPSSQYTNAGDQKILQRFREAMLLPNVFADDDDSDPNDPS